MFEKKRVCVVVVLFICRKWDLPLFNSFLNEIDRLIFYSRFFISFLLTHLIEYTWTRSLRKSCFWELTMTSNLCKNSIIRFLRVYCTKRPLHWVFSLHSSSWLSSLYFSTHSYFISKPFIPSCIKYSGWNNFDEIIIQILLMNRKKVFFFVKSFANNECKPNKI